VWSFPAEHLLRPYNCFPRPEMQAASRRFLFKSGLEEDVGAVHD
jgi:hypothetical protein